MPPAPAGSSCSTHTDPVVVPIAIDPEPGTPLDPTARQSTAFAHDTPVRSTALEGVVWEIQEVPLVVDPTA
jgi:hypothetical protein